jgi:hypothetical protein
MAIRPNPKKEKAMLLFQLRPSAASPMFLSTSYLGELVARDEKKGILTMRNVCIVYEGISTDKDGRGNIGLTYYTHSFISNGVVTFKTEDMLWARDVEEGDEFLVGYKSAIEEFGLSKLRIQRATSMPRGLKDSREERI